MTKPKAKRLKMRAYSSGSGMVWRLMTTRTEPPEFAAKKGLGLRLLKVPVWKSPIGLFKMPEPTQAEDCPLV